MAALQRIDNNNNTTEKAPYQRRYWIPDGFDGASNYSKVMDFSSREEADIFCVELESFNEAFAKLQKANKGYIWVVKAMREKAAALVEKWGKHRIPKNTRFFIGELDELLGNSKTDFGPDVGSEEQFNLEQVGAREAALQAIKDGTERVTFGGPDHYQEFAAQTMERANTQQICAVCRKPAAHKCARCKCTYYCCREHQIQDWKENNHELLVCKQISRLETRK